MPLSCHQHNAVEHTDRENGLTHWNRVKNDGLSSIMELKL